MVCGWPNSDAGLDVVGSDWRGTQMERGEQVGMENDEMVTVFKEFTFEAAHSLPHLPAEHKCHHLHGHSYHVTVFARSLDRYLKNGMVIDYADLSDSWAVLFHQLDHRFINEVPGLEISTSECLSKWIYLRMKEKHPQVCRVIVKETPTAGAVYGN
jgi:6-pyruvoyltetrahydropterin/6-carboxytetrahydropterin synthase